MVNVAMVRHCKTTTVYTRSGLKLNECIQELRKGKKIPDSRGRTAVGIEKHQLQV